MARRRFQNPTPKRRGDWGTIQIRQDLLVQGKLRRVNKRVRLAPATMAERQVRKIAAEYLRPLNQELEGIGAATNFTRYVDNAFRPVNTPLLATSTRDRYEGVPQNYILPAFGALCLRDLTPLTVHAISLEWRHFRFLCWLPRQERANFDEWSEIV